MVAFAALLCGVAVGMVAAAIGTIAGLGLLQNIALYSFTAALTAALILYRPHRKEPHHD